MQDNPREEVPEWLRSLRESPMEDTVQGGPSEEPLEPLTPAAVSPSEGEPMLDNLREQAMRTDLEEVVGPPPRAGLAAMLQGLAPWQRFVLALLLFLNVALLGCMCLVMTGRVVPFH